MENAMDHKVPEVLGLVTSEPLHVNFSFGKCWTLGFIYICGVYVFMYAS